MTRFTRINHATLLIAGLFTLGIGLAACDEAPNQDQGGQQMQQQPTAPQSGGTTQ